MVFISYDHNWDTFPAYQLNSCKQKRLNYSGRTEIVFLWNDSGEYWDSMAAGSDEYSNQRMLDRMHTQAHGKGQAVYLPVCDRNRTCVSGKS